MNDTAIRAAQAHVQRDRLVELCCALVDVPSPTGQEAALARTIAAFLRDAGAGGEVQSIDEHQANAWGSLPGRGGCPTLMLYAPIDTMTTGTAEHDLPQLGEALVDHMLPRAHVQDDRVTGLGAMNPKGHAACILGAVEAIARSGVALEGELIAAFGAGGMPTNALNTDDRSVRNHVGHGVGCSFLLEQGVWADAAIIAKSGWAVSWEEVGLAWCDVHVRGTHTYVGARHLLPYRNAIADAAAVVSFLEDWFPRRTADKTTGHVAPQAIVSAIEGGWWRMPAFTPASARLRVDMRLAPGESPLAAKRELEHALIAFATDQPGLDFDVRLALGVPGSRTDPEHWVTRCAVAAWETETGDTHRASDDTSGATDANILRNRGIPTVRVGLPKSLHDGQPLPFAEGMNTVDIDALETLTRYLVRVAICGTSQR